MLRSTSRTCVLQASSPAITSTSHYSYKHGEAPRKLCGSSLAQGAETVHYWVINGKGCPRVSAGFQFSREREITREEQEMTITLKKNDKMPKL